MEIAFEATPTNSNNLVLKTRRIAFLLVLIIGGAWLAVYTQSDLLLEPYLPKYSDWLDTFYVIAGFCLVVGALVLLVNQLRVSEFYDLTINLRTAAMNDDLHKLIRDSKMIEGKCGGNSLLLDWWVENEHLVSLVKDKLQKTQQKRQVAVVTAIRTHSVLTALRQKKLKQPVIVALDVISQRLAQLIVKRDTIKKQWDEAYKRFFWWDKISRDEPDFTEMDKTIADFEKTKAKIQSLYESSVGDIEKAFVSAFDLANSRIKQTEREVQKYIEESRISQKSASEILNVGFWFSALSIPVSMWDDFSDAGDVYDALRRVNSNYEGLSDTEIWLDSLLMNSSSLAGLVSLTKGAYFESLVASKTGGALFENFNHAGTDITIDGIEYQIKATDSVDYIYSVDEMIPVIATLEVAEKTGVIDGGYSDENLEIIVDNAMGGTVIDIHDRALDAWIAGLGGIGLMASFRGIDHAFKLVENGGDQVEAAMEGVVVAIGGTAKAAVGTAEVAYNIAMSAPSRFMGRAILGGIKALDDKLGNAAAEANTKKGSD